jgi:hypothetical protein
MARPLPLASTFLLIPCLLASAAHAGGAEPGSFLLFPEFDNSAGQMTFLTVTNANSDVISGSVDVHFVYVNSASCLEDNRNEFLTARDTKTFLTSAHVPNVARGYAYAYAIDHTTHHLTDFDWLIGASLRIDALAPADYSIQPLVFLGRPGAGLDTDVNHNGRPDLNGIEYDKAPNKFFVPRFFGQAAEPLPRGTYASDLILLQPLVAPGTTTNTAFLIWNDNEETYSAQYSFQCWTRTRLLNISGTFSAQFLQNTNDAPLEVVGNPMIEAGWFQVRGVTATSQSGQSVANPPVFGVLVEVKPYSAADLPFIEHTP